MTSQDGCGDTERESGRGKGCEAGGERRGGRRHAVSGRRLETCFTCQEVNESDDVCMRVSIEQCGIGRADAGPADEQLGREDVGGRLSSAASL